MTLYIFEAWEKYRENFGLLVATSFVITLISLGQLVPNDAVKAVFSLIGVFTASIAYVFVYQKILGTYKEFKDSLVQGLWAWLAQMVVGIVITVVLLISLVFLLIPPIGRVLTLAAWVAAVAFAAKFMYIPYLAAKGEKFDEILKKSWNTKLRVALSALAGMFIVGIGIAVVAGIPLLTVIYKIVEAITGPETIWSFLTDPAVAISFLISTVIYLILAPILWMFPLVSGKDAVGE